LAKKFYHEVIDWQKKDGAIYAPVPAGNWNVELPIQMLNTIGYYGIWDYYFHTGDTASLIHAYEGIKKYLSLWEFQANGLVKHRPASWDWGDWGQNIDMEVIENAWFYLACKSYRNMSKLFLKEKEYQWSSSIMQKMENSFNRVFWNGNEYRGSQYKDLTDDRANALAVLAGFAKPQQFEKIKRVLEVQKHASPYMEKYVLESHFMMGYHHAAIERMQSRFKAMIASPLTTLWEGWGIGKEGFGGGTYNHAWSGCGLTLLSQYVAGIKPASVAFDTVAIYPHMGKMMYNKAGIVTKYGKLEVVNKIIPKAFDQTITSEYETNFKIYKPAHVKFIQSATVNHKLLDNQLLQLLNSNQPIILKSKSLNIYFDHK
jgi:hypothetical protein